MFQPKLFSCKMCNFYTISHHQFEEHLKTHYRALKKIDVTLSGGGIVPSSTQFSSINPIGISTEFIPPNLPVPIPLQSPTPFKKENSILANLLQKKNNSESNQAVENCTNFFLAKESVTSPPVSASGSNEKYVGKTSNFCLEELKKSSVNNYLGVFSPMNSSFQSFQFTEKSTALAVRASHNGKVSMSETIVIGDEESNSNIVADILPIDISSEQDFQPNEELTSAVYDGAISIDESLSICDKISNKNGSGDILLIDRSSAQDVHSNENLIPLPATTYGATAHMDETLTACDEGYGKSIVVDFLPISDSNNAQDIQSSSSFNYLTPEKSLKDVENNVLYYNDIDFNAETEILMHSEVMNEILDNFFQNSQNNEILPAVGNFSHIADTLSLNKSSGSKSTEILDISNYCLPDNGDMQNRSSHFISDCNYFPQEITMDNFNSNIPHTVTNSDSYAISSEFNGKIIKLNDQPDKMSYRTNILSVVKDSEKSTQENILDKNCLPTEQSISCPICPFKCNIKSVMQNHVQLHQPREGTKYKCCICPYFAATKHCVQIHLKDHHSLPEYIDEKCNSNKSRYEKASKTCTTNEKEIQVFKDCEQSPKELKIVNTRRNKQFFCPECPFKTSRRKCLSNHRKFHTSEEFSLKCKYCSFGANSQTVLNAHTKLHRTSDAKVSNDMQPTIEYSAMNWENDKQDDLFNCKLCTWKGDSKSKFELHSQEHTSVGKFPCPYCGFQAVTSRGFSIHLKKHGKKVKMDNRHVKTTSMKSRRNKKVDRLSFGTEELVVNKKLGSDVSNEILKNQQTSFENQLEVQYSGNQFENLNVNHQVLNSDTYARQKFEEIINDPNGVSLENLRTLLMKLNNLYSHLPIEHFAKKIAVVSPLEIYNLQKSLAVAVQEPLEEPAEVIKMETIEEDIVEDSSNELCYKDGKLYFTH